MNTLIKLLLLVLALFASTVYAETLYTYRQVGLCNGAQINIWANPTDKPLIKCLYVLSSKLELAVFPESQKVVIIEEDLNKSDKEVLNLSSGSFGQCSVVDKENFTCEGFVRVNGGFTNTEALNGRIISRSSAFKLYSSFVDYSTEFMREFLDNSIASWLVSTLKWLALGVIGFFAIIFLISVLDKEE